MNHLDLNIYHIYAQSLTNTPFINDYQTLSHNCGEIAKWIPHIKDMGFNAVMFSPMLKSRSHGYDVTDYFEIDNRIGTNAEFKELVALFHENKIKVILDSVFNHCGRDFKVFQELKNGDRSKAEWFMGVDFNRQSPMGDYFDYSTWSGYYELVKFNLGNHNARNYLLEAAKFWITEFDIDGMRLDSANVMDFGFMRDLRALCTGVKNDFWLMGEVVSGDYARWVNNEHLHSVTGYMLYKALYSAVNSNNLYELENTVSRAVPMNGLPLFNFLDNHDQPRIASISERREYLPSLYTMLYTLPGIPSVYYGSEWELKGVKENGSDAPLRPFINISEPPADTDLTRLIKKLSKIRSSLKSLRNGSYRTVFLKYHEPFVFAREFEGERVYIAVNTQDRDFTISFGNEQLTDIQTSEKCNTGSLFIPAYGTRILTNSDLITYEETVERVKIELPNTVIERETVKTVEIKKEIHEPTAKSNITAGQKYRHFKGNLYEIIAVGTDTDTNESVVVYKGEDGKIWVRPQIQFEDMVGEKKRFELL